MTLGRVRSLLAVITAIVFGATGVALIQAPAQAVVPAASPALDKFVNELPNPLAPPFRLDATAGGPVALDEVVATHSFGTQGGVPFARTPSFGYWPSGVPLDPTWGAYLGPTIEAKKGAPIQLTVTNKLEVGTPAVQNPEDCTAANLPVIHPLANYFDPTIEGTKDINKCAPATAVHLHGGASGQASDGGPMDVYHPAGINTDDYAGGTGAFTYNYANDQEAAGLWYHDHAMADTRFNPMSGLAGYYLLRDDNDTGHAGNSQGLPYTDATAAHEVPIVLQDRQFNADGTLAYPPGVSPYHPNWTPESFGDVAVVNGTAWPKWTVKQGLYRVRLLNGSNARFYQLQMQDAKTITAPIPIYQIGAEGGLFNSPVPITALPNGRLLIAPGERADLVFDFRNVPTGAYTWFNNASAPFPGGSNNLKQVMQFNVTAGNDQPVDARWTPTPWKKAPAAQTGVVLRGSTGQEPAMGATVPRVAGTPSTNSCWTATNTTRPCIRTMFLNEVLDPATGEPVEVLLNNLNLAHEQESPPTPTGFAMNTGPGQAQVNGNSVEEWDIVNVSADAHPIHLHTTQFQVIDRQDVDSTRYLAAVNPGLPFGAAFTTPTGPGGTGVQNSNGATPPPDPTPFLKNIALPPRANEHGWKDTVIANPRQVTRVLVPFGGTSTLGPGSLPAGYTGPTSSITGGAQPGTFVWHCHILEHEENDMMQAMVIKP